VVSPYPDKKTTSEYVQWERASTLMITSMGDFTGVVTTGIYCRPGCGARPNAENTRKFTLAAAAEAAGYRACLRCRPYRELPTSNLPAPELVCRAVQQILDGALDEENEHDLGARLGLSARHLRRLFVEHLGTTPDQLARSARSHFARRLLDDTDFRVADIAFAAGFGSVRQLNRAFKEVFRDTPHHLRARRRASDRLVADGGLALRLYFRPPLDWEAMLGYLDSCSLAGVEKVTGNVYRRTVLIDGDPGAIELSPGGRDYILFRAHLPHWEGLIHLVQRARRIFNLDGDSAGAAAHLGSDPLIGPLIRKRPGIRPPGTWEPFEIGVKAIAQQYMGNADADSIMTRLVEQHGTIVPGLGAWGLTHLFPSASILAAADLSGLDLTPSAKSAVNAFARAVASKAVHLDRGRTLDCLIQSITGIQGLDLCAAHYVAMRIGEPDSFPSPVQLGRHLSHVTRQPTANHAFDDQSEAWRPWRAHVHMYLSTADQSPISMLQVPRQT
jgi:AraC family transcriptional regulator of adaptative response / DNA-3-methyladenine glycosylase II